MLLSDMADSSFQYSQIIDSQRQLLAKLNKPTLEFSNKLKNHLELRFDLQSNQKNKQIG